MIQRKYVVLTNSQPIGDEHKDIRTATEKMLHLTKSKAKPIAVSIRAVEYIDGEIFGLSELTPAERKEMCDAAGWEY